MQRCIYYIACLTIMASACTPKVAETVATPAPEVTPKTDVVKNPCTMLDDLTGEENQSVSTAFILYRDLVKAGKFAEALPLWRQAYNKAPGSNGRVKYHFDDGVKIYRYLGDQTTDSLQKKYFVDTILMIYDKRISCFGEEGYVSGLKGFDLYYYHKGLVADSVIFGYLRANLDIKGENADYFVLNPAARLLYDGILAGYISRPDGQKYAAMIMSALQKGLSTCKDAQCETWRQIEAYAPAQLDMLEGIDDFYDCSHYQQKYYTLFRQFPDSCDIVNKAFSGMSRGKCNPNSAEMKEVLAARNTKCYVAPENPGPLRRGYDAYAAGDYKGAIKSFSEFIETNDDKELKAKYLLLISKIYYGDLKDFPKSRKYALDAAKVKPSWGEPYMLIGKLYASSGPLCGPGTGWESQIVTWAAIDKFTYAKNIDPSVAKEANQWISRYSQYMPKREDIFFRGIAAGSTFLVPCWIQERTTVRTSD